MSEEIPPDVGTGDGAAPNGEVPPGLDDVGAQPGAGGQTLSPVARARSLSPVMRAVAVAALAIVIMGAGIGISLAVSTAPTGGAASPAAAVDDLLLAADHGDVLGALAVLAPGERSALEPSLTALVDQLKRLEVLSSSASLAKVSGLSLRFSNVKTSTSYLGTSLAAVRITSGKVSGVANLGELPLGSFVRQRAGGRLHGVTRSSSSLAGNARIATIEVGGRWYVSIGYTIAVGELIAKHESPAPPANGVTPTGAATPEGAVSDLLDSIASFDLRGLIADLDPGEMGALQAYAPRFLSRAEQTLGLLRDVVHVEIAHRSMSTTTVADGTLVRITSIDLSATGPSFALRYSHNCLSGTVKGVPVRSCGRGSTTSPAQLLPGLGPLLAGLKPMDKRLAKASSKIGIMTVDDNGRYYVSPTRTLFESVDALLGALRPRDLDMIASLFTALEKLVGAHGLGVVSRLAPASTTL